MPQQPEVTSPPLAPNPARAPGEASGLVSGSAAGLQLVSEHRTAGEVYRQNPQRIPRWLERSELFLRVFLRIYIGLAICYAPWSGQVLKNLPWSRVLWDQNPLFLHFPALGVYAASGAVRGLVSGLGLLNLWFAFQDAFRHRDG